MQSMTLDEMRALWNSARPEGQAVAAGAPPVTQSGPLAVTVRPEGIVPPVGVESTGTPRATTPAIDPLTAVPLEVRTADTTPKPSEGASELDVMIESVWQTESDNKHIDPKTGKPVQSKAGAVGASQLIPKTAAGLGIDPADEAQNREGGKRYLAQQFNKYGNWRDALGAYYAGPGAYDKWLDGGSKRNTPLGKQITEYQDTTLARAGILERGGSLRTAPDGRPMLSLQDMRTIFNDLPPSAPEEEDRRAQRKRDREGGTFAEESGDRAKALAYGLYKGARNFELAPIQAIAEQFAPDGAKWLTERVAEVDKPWEPLTSKHSWMSGAGEIVGGTAALLATARLLGPAVGAVPGVAGVMQTLAPRVPWMLNASGGLTTAGRYAASVPAGAAITAGTTFTRSGDASDRIPLAILGGLMGPLGVTLGQALAKAMTVATRPNELAAMMGELKKNAAIVEPDLNYLKNVAVSRIGKMEQEAGRRYETATATGKTVRGLDAETVANTVRNYTTKSVSQIEQVKNRLFSSREVGLGAEAERAAVAQVQHQQYADHVRTVTRAQEAFLDKQLGANAGNQPMRQAYRAQMQNDPLFPQPTMAAPAPYTPGVMSAEQFMKARQLLEAEKRTASTRAKRDQISGLKAELDKSFAAAARDAGLSASQFYRRLLSADHYYKANVVPAHDMFERWFGKSFRGANRIKDDTVNKLTQGLDGTHIFEKVVSTIENGTAREVAAMMYVFGTTPADKEKLVRSIAMRALTKAESGIGKDFDPTAVRKYIDDNHKNLARVLSPEQYRWMQGFAKASESLAEQAAAAVRQDPGFWRSSRILNIFGLEHFSRGEYASGAKLMLSGLFAHTLVNNLGKLREGVTARLIGDVSKLQPGSPAFNARMEQIKWRMEKGAVVGARTIGDTYERATGGPPVPSFQPRASMAP